MISPDQTQSKLDALRDMLVSYLDGDRESWREVVTALESSRLGVRETVVSRPEPLPECRLFDQRILADAAALLCWQQNPGYRDSEFLRHYRYCELMGMDGHALHCSYAVGLLYLRPQTHYPAHSHAAEEIYHVLTEGSQWRMADTEWHEPVAGSRIFHPGGISHQMRTGSSPLLALYLWRGDLLTKATLD